MSNPKTFWTEPEKDNHKWKIAKYDAISGKVLGTASFNTEREAWKELKKINIYINGKQIETTTK